MTRQTTDGAFSSSSCLGSGVVRRRSLASFTAFFFFGLGLSETDRPSGPFCIYSVHCYPELHSTYLTYLTYPSAAWSGKRAPSQACIDSIPYRSPCCDRWRSPWTVSKLLSPFTLAFHSILGRYLRVPGYYYYIYTYRRHLTTISCDMGRYSEGANSL
ncbi:hypothetical protein F5B18DRAFT_623889 [Nemania serpens]|nr:hypothetical protein F5B18DRAFT_623889 [Nemania serpens]